MIMNIRLPTHLLLVHLLSPTSRPIMPMSWNVLPPGLVSMVLLAEMLSCRLVLIFVLPQMRLWQKYCPEIKLETAILRAGLDCRQGFLKQVSELGGHGFLNLVAGLFIIETGNL